MGRPRSSDKVCQELPWDHCLVNPQSLVDEEAQIRLVLSLTCSHTGLLYIY